MSHLILAQSSGVDLNEALLQAFAFMSRELGRLMASRMLPWCQIWLAQLPLTEPYAHFQLFWDSCLELLHNETRSDPSR